MKIQGKKWNMRKENEIIKNNNNNKSQKKSIVFIISFKTWT